MKNILGIGTAGCNIIKQLSEYPVYRCFYISNEIKKTTKYKYSLEELPGPEEYENSNMDKLHRWLDKITEHCTVFLCGASDSSGITLRALERLHRNNVSMEIVYFSPETDVLSETKILHERSVSGIMQNFARSGLFEKMYMVSNVALEKLAGNTNVYDYYDQINHVFSSTYYMLDVFKNTKPLTSTFKKPKESCRLATFGIASLHEDFKDKLFFPFQQEVEMIYYYGINENKLRTEENLFRKITDLIKGKITNDRKASFGVYPTQYEEDYVYVELFSPKIQNLIIDTE